MPYASSTELTVNTDFKICIADGEGFISMNIQLQDSPYFCAERKRDGKKSQI